MEREAQEMERKEAAVEREAHEMERQEAAVEREITSAGTPRRRDGNGPLIKCSAKPTTSSVSLMAIK